MNPLKVSDQSITLTRYRFSHVAIYNRDIQYFPGNKKAAINAAWLLVSVIT